MTTKEVTTYLGKSKAWCYRMVHTAKIRTTISPSGDSVWDAEDVERMRVLLDYGVQNDWDWAKQYTVIYCRTEPVEALTSAAQRLRAQRDRMVAFAQGRGMEPDLVLAEVRPVLRYGTMSVNSSSTQTKPTAMQSLLGLLGQRKIHTLIIETRDRLAAVDGWFFIEALLRAMGVKEIVVANSVWPTIELRAESTGWMADLLARYKVLTGEIRDQSTVDVFMRGYDPKQTFIATAKIEAKLTQREKEKRRPAWAKLPADKRVLDLDDCWEV